MSLHWEQNTRWCARVNRQRLQQPRYVFCECRSVFEKRAVPRLGAYRSPCSGTRKSRVGVSQHRLRLSVNGTEHDSPGRVFTRN